MTALSKIKRNVKPSGIVRATPDFFEPNWDKRPTTDVAIGLRFLSVRELAECRLEAEREATGFYEEHPPGANPMGDVVVEQYNEVLLCEAMARATCDPNNRMVPYFDNAVVTVRAALTSEGLRRLWDEYQKLSIATGVTIAPATDAELALVGRCLRSEVGRRVLTVEGRKLCTYLLERLKDVMPETPDDDEREILTMAAEDDADDAESVYVARTQ